MLEEPMVNNDEEKKTTPDNKRKIILIGGGALAAFFALSAFCCVALVVSGLFLGPTPEAEVEVVGWERSLAGYVYINYKVENTGEHEINSYRFTIEAEDFDGVIHKDNVRGRGVTIPPGVTRRGESSLGRTPAIKDVRVVNVRLNN